MRSAKCKALETGFAAHGPAPRRRRLPTCRGRSWPPTPPDARPECRRRLSGRSFDTPSTPSPPGRCRAPRGQSARDSDRSPSRGRSSHMIEARCRSCHYPCASRRASRRAVLEFSLPTSSGWPQSRPRRVARLCVRVIACVHQCLLALHVLEGVCCTRWMSAVDSALLCGVGRRQPDVSTSPGPATRRGAAPPTSAP